MVFGGEGGNCRAGGNAGIGDGMFGRGTWKAVADICLGSNQSRSNAYFPAERVGNDGSAKEDEANGESARRHSDDLPPAECRRVLAADRDARGEERSWIHVYV